MKFTALLLVLCCCTKQLFSQQGYWQQQVNYIIDATLDDATNTITGFEQMEYINNSPDTLQFIYIHLWPNAYKNDRTAFSEQLLQEDRTDFYFSDEDKKGYINQLDFTSNNTQLRLTQTKDIDVIQLWLNEPLAPGQTVKIQTPFHEKIPYLFSRGGYANQFYAITQWYPKAALYDDKGWHQMHYVDQGEFYNDFGNYTVHITLPENYIVGATGVLTGNTANVATVKRKEITEPVKKKNGFAVKKESEVELVPSSNKLKTLSYSAEHVTDFAWFADKRFIVKTDTIQLNGKSIQANCYILPENEKNYKDGIRFIKQAVRFYSNAFGDYPYPQVSVVAGPENLTGLSSMEYPMITMVTESTVKETDATTAHEIGHNWLMAILSTNERDHAWMDEGINTYIERKYRQTYYPPVKGIQNFNTSGLNGDGVHTLLNAAIGLKRDQPIETTSENFTTFNYGAVVYEKTADWMEYFEKKIGADTMHMVLRKYYSAYAFKHPTPADFKQAAEEVCGRSLDDIFFKLNETGYIDSSHIPHKYKPSFLIPGSNSNYRYISAGPAIGYNGYDNFMAGIVIHNYQLPLQKFQFLIAPMYATGSKKFAGAGRLSYNYFTKQSWLEMSVSGMHYSIDSYDPGTGDKLYFGLTRIVPSIKLSLYSKDILKKTKWTFQLRSFLLNKEQLDFKTVITPIDTTDVPYAKKINTSIQQFNVGFENNRILYPYSGKLNIDQGEHFLRLGFTGKYFFNYNASKEGMQLRVFAGKYFTLGNTNSYESYYTNLNMSGPKGNEDYTYSGYFFERNAYEGWQSQQIMERDGFFKVRTDLLSDKIGKSSNWLLAMNLSGDIPDQVNPLNALPFKLPVKLFLDLGTYSEAWQNDQQSGKILYDAGLQLSLLGNGLNIYFPLLYSKVYNDYFKSTLGKNRFSKIISFDINLHVLQLTKISRDIPW